MDTVVGDEVLLGFSKVCISGSGVSREVSHVDAAITLDVDDIALLAPQTRSVTKTGNWRKIYSRWLLPRDALSPTVSK